MSHSIQNNLIEQLLEITEEMHERAIDNAWTEVSVIDLKRQAVLKEISLNNIEISAQIYSCLENILSLDSEIVRCIENKLNGKSISTLQFQHAHSEYSRFSN